MENIVVRIKNKASEKYTQLIYRYQLRVDRAASFRCSQSQEEMVIAVTNQLRSEAGNTDLLQFIRYTDSQSSSRESALPALVLF
jgi:hypothetical protein